MEGWRSVRPPKPARYEYLLVTTYRRNSTPVATPGRVSHPCYGAQATSPLKHQLPDCASRAALLEGCLDACQGERK